MVTCHSKMRINLGELKPWINMQGTNSKVQPLSNSGRDCQKVSGISINCQKTYTPSWIHWKIELLGSTQFKLAQFADRMDICDNLFKLNLSYPFLKQIITGDEKCILYYTLPNDTGKSEEEIHV